MKFPVILLLLVFLYGGSGTPEDMDDVNRMKSAKMKFMDFILLARSILFTAVFIGILILIMPGRNFRIVPLFLYSSLVLLYLRMSYIKLLSSELNENFNEYMNGIYKFIAEETFIFSGLVIFSAILISDITQWRDLYRMYVRLILLFIFLHVFVSTAILLWCRYVLLEDNSPSA